VKDPDKLAAFNRQWAEMCWDLLPPGGHLACFAGTRHYHRQVLAVEEAGFDLRDTILWLYGGGMPKSRNLRDGSQYDGYGTGLKPAFNLIALFRKPPDRVIFANQHQYGTGMLNIDGGRVPTTDNLGGGNTSADRSPRLDHDSFKRPWMDDSEWRERHAIQVRANVGKAEKLGRWPANVVLDDEAAYMLDASTGDLKAGGNLNGNEPSSPYKNVYGEMHQRGEWESYGDSGGASRFFYCAKAAPGERSAGLPDGLENKHPSCKPIALMRWLVRLLTSPGDRVLDPMAGSGSTLCACMLEGRDGVGVEERADHALVAYHRFEHYKEEAMVEAAAA
jgi:site-specific DNA-methyltransferase (adenine-specific)